MRLRQLLKAKIHHATVTYANPDYVGSIEICSDLMERVGLFDGEMVHVWGVDNQSRIVTYAFAGPRGVIGLNGGAAQFFKTGDRVIIAAFDLSDTPIVPNMVLVDGENRVVRDMTPFSVVG
jgi:aspartate 1-decarboxylase